MKIGVISDTHSFVDPQVHSIFKGVSHILHAGDIGDESVISELETIAPVIAVSGNGDYKIRNIFPPERSFDLGGKRIFLCHWHILTFGFTHPTIHPELHGMNPDVFIYGHLHEARVDDLNGVLHVNPGYSGPKDSPYRKRTVVILTISKGKAVARIIELH